MLLTKRVLPFLLVGIWLSTSARADILSGPLDFKFDGQSGYTTLNVMTGAEFNGPSPVPRRGWNWVVDINDLQINATATITSAFEIFPTLEMKYFTIPGYTITGVTFNNTLPSGAIDGSLYSNTPGGNLCRFNSSTKGFEKGASGTEFKFQANLQVQAVPEPGFAMAICGGLFLTAISARRFLRSK